jgi:hypothetical protein
MTALCNEHELQTLKLIFPNAEITIVEHFETLQTSKGRFKEIQYQYKVKLDTGNNIKKQTLYQELVRDMFKDQLAWIKDRNHIRRINQDNAVNSLQIAGECEQLAAKV